MSCFSIAVKFVLYWFAIVLLSNSTSAQGPLTNGFTHTGSLSANEQVAWSFEAKSGDGIMLKLGEAVAGSPLCPRVRLYGPDSVLVGEGAGLAAAEVAIRATNSGTFTVMVANAENLFPGGSGAYRLTLAKTGTAVFVASYDEGGPMTNGATYVATNGIAGLDLWTFNACPGDSLILKVIELTGGASFSPKLILYAPDGTLLDRVSGATAAQISRVAPMAGSYLLIVGDTTAGYGTYQLTGSGFVDGFQLCPPQIQGAANILAGVGGQAGSDYVILTSTDALPTNVWTPIYTNQFGPFGEFSVTNIFNGELPLQYFRVRSP